MTREDIQRMTTAPDCFVPTPDVVRELARLAIASDRARRVGEAVIEAGQYVPFMIECAIQTIENGSGFDGDDLPRIRAFRATINTALRGEP